MPAAVLLITEAKQAVQMYQQGHSQKQIARAIGRSRKAVRTGLRHMGVEARSSAEGYRTWLELRGGRGNRLTPKRKP